MYKTIRAISAITVFEDILHLLLDIGADVILKAEEDTADHPDDEDHPDDDEGGNENEDQQPIVLLSENKMVQQLFHILHMLKMIEE